MAKTNSCVDCATPCDKRCQRCQTCSNKINGKSRPRNPKLCKCGAELAKKKYKYCHSCNMKKRWSNKTYYKNTKAAIKASFDARWADPILQKKMVKVLTTYIGTSKLEKRVAKIALNYGYTSSVAIGRYLADILNENKKTIVEVNGDYWHCNPKIWKADEFHAAKKKTAQEVWDLDNKRKIYLESLGYTVYVLWEQDIVKGKELFVSNFFESIK